jgi:thioredoxin
MNTFDNTLIRLIAPSAALLCSEPKVVQNEDKALEEILARKRNELLKGRTASEIRTREILFTPVKLTDSNFSQAIARYPLIVVDFWAAWCGPCRVVSPAIEQLATELAGKVVFGKLNVDENPVTANAFGIQSIPTITIFKNGGAIDAIIGAASKSQIQTKLLTHI